jgi:hypothetical protein
MPTDDGVRPRAGLVAVLCVLASVTLTGSAMLAIPVYRTVLGGAPIFEGLGTTAVGQPPILTTGGAVVAVVAVLLLRRFGAPVWPWLVLAGALLGLTAAVPYVVSADQLSVVRAPAFVLAAGAAPVLVVVGLYGAASWLNHVASLRAAAPVIGAAVLAPLTGLFVLPVVAGDFTSGSPVFAVMAALAALGVLAAAGCAALVLTVRLEPRTAALSGRATIVGVLAGLLAAVPELVAGIGWHPVQISATSDPNDPLKDVVDAWALRHGGAGLLVVVAAAVLAGVLGARVLGTVFAAGLLTYGVLQPVASLGQGLAAGAALGLFLAGIVLGVALAMTRWRVWFAAGSAALLAVLTIMPVLAGSVAAPEPVSEPMGAATLVLAGLAVVTGVVAAASALRERAVLPVAFGLLAVAVEVGLYHLGAFTQHSAIAGANLRSTLGLLYPIAALALLFGGLLVLVVASERRAALPQVRPLDVGADQT